MAAISYTKTTERKTFPRIFIMSEIGAQTFADYRADSVVTDGKIDDDITWIQLSTVGGASLTRTRNTSPLENDQMGTIDMVIDSEPMELSFNLSSDGLMELQGLMKFTPGNAFTAGTTAYTGIKDSRGHNLKDYALGVLIVGADYDVDNYSNTPGLVGGVGEDAKNLKDPNAWLFFHCAIGGDSSIKWNENQKSFEVTLTPLPNTGSGSARGIRGVFGLMTVDAVAAP